MSYDAHWLLLIHVIHVLIFCISNISSVFFFCEVEAQSWSHVADQASTRSTSPEVGPGESQGRGDIQRGAAQADPQLSDASGALGRRTMFRKFLHFCAANMSTYHPKVLKDKYSELQCDWKMVKTFKPSDWALKRETDFAEEFVSEKPCRRPEGRVSCCYDSLGHFHCRNLSLFTSKSNSIRCTRLKSLVFGQFEARMSVKVYIHIFACVCVCICIFV